MNNIDNYFLGAYISWMMNLLVGGDEAASMFSLDWSNLNPGKWGKWFYFKPARLLTTYHWIQAYSWL